MIEIFAFTADGIRYTTDIKTNDLEEIREVIKKDLKVESVFFEYYPKKDPQTIDKMRSI